MGFFRRKKNVHLKKKNPFGKWRDFGDGLGGRRGEREELGCLDIGEIWGGNGGLRSLGGIGAVGELEMGGNGILGDIGGNGNVGGD